MLTFRGSTMTLERSESSSQNNQKASVELVVFPKLQQFEELPPWYQDNPFIRRGYRAESRSVPACVESLKYVHNETVNIYTHLLPAVALLAAQNLLQKKITDEFPDATLTDHAIFSINLFAATVTFVLSTSYHTFMNHSFPVSQLWLRIDYVGILILILASFHSGIFVGFYCEPLLRRVYWSMIVTLSIITSILVLHPKLQGLKYRSCRTSAFVITALSGLAPIGHGLLKYGWDQMWVQSGMPYWFLEGIIYGLGAFFFASRIPESIWPGKYDVWGTSHQIFHVLVVVASMVHMLGVWEAFKYNYVNNRNCHLIEKQPFNNWKN